MRRRSIPEIGHAEDRRLEGLHETTACRPAHHEPIW
jgi:hypothetical protein